MTDNNNDDIEIPPWLRLLLGQGASDAITAAIKYLPDLILKVFDHETAKAATFINAVAEDQWQNLVDHYIASGLITEDQAAAIVALKDTAAPLNLILFVGAAILMANSYLQATLDPMQAIIAQSQNAALRPGLPDYNALINTSFIAPERHEEVVDVMRRHGIPDSMIELLFISRYRLYDVTQVKELYLRGVLTEEKMYERMRELGFTDTRTHEIIQGWEIIPGPQDLFWMVGKEAFEPDSIAELGLGDEFPTEQLDWLRKQGISEYWAQKYWYAHWDQPSIGQGYEMLHRGVINDDQLDMLFRTVEIPPFWRDKLKQIAYQPYTRVDARRMHDLGVLADSDLVKVYMDQGYDEEHATNMAYFTILYNQSNDKELTRSQVMAAYKEGIISRSDIIDMLEQLGYSEDRAEFIVQYQDYETELEYQSDLIKNVTDRYILNLITESEARNLLVRMNLPSERIDIIMDKASIKVYKNRAKIPKSDLKEMFTSGVIDESRYRSYMTALGYSADQIDYYVKLYTLEVDNGDT